MIHPRIRMPSEGLVARNGTGPGPATDARTEWITPELGKDRHGERKLRAGRRFVSALAGHQARRARKVAGSALVDGLPREPRDARTWKGLGQGFCRSHGGGRVRGADREQMSTAGSVAGARGR